MEYAYISTIGQDSHRFEIDAAPSGNVIRLGATDIPHDRRLIANSDGDVVLHAITNAVSGYTGVNILGSRADKICLEQGIRDSRIYLAEALKYMNGATIVHCSMTIECLAPKLMQYIDQMKSNIGDLLEIPQSCVGITATTGEGLTSFGRGEGIQVFVILTIQSSF